jgi:hypothetical protein
MKIEKLNIDLYHNHVKAANELGKLWCHIEDKIKETVIKEMVFEKIIINTGCVRRNT